MGIPGYTLITKDQDGGGGGQGGAKSSGTERRCSHNLLRDQSVVSGISKAAVYFLVISTLALRSCFPFSRWKNVFTVRKGSYMISCENMVPI